MLETFRTGLIVVLCAYAVCGYAKRPRQVERYPTLPRVEILRRSPGEAQVSPLYTAHIVCGLLEKIPSIDQSQGDGHGCSSSRRWWHSCGSCVSA